jgi:hypothetical protein
MHISSVIHPHTVSQELLTISVQDATYLKGDLPSRVARQSPFDRLVGSPGARLCSRW